MCKYECPSIWSLLACVGGLAFTSPSFSYTYTHTLTYTSFLHLSLACSLSISSFLCSPLAFSTPLSHVVGIVAFSCATSNLISFSLYASEWVTDGEKVGWGDTIEKNEKTRPYFLQSTTLLSRRREGVPNSQFKHACLFLLVLVWDLGNRWLRWSGCYTPKQKAKSIGYLLFYFECFVYLV